MLNLVFLSSRVTRVSLNALGKVLMMCVSGGKSVCENAWRGIVVYSYYLF